MSWAFLNVLGSMVGLIAAGLVVLLLCWALRDERPFWIQGLTVAALISFLVIYPLYLLISSWANTNPYQPYDDSPIQTMDRYS